MRFCEEENSGWNPSPAPTCEGIYKRSVGQLEYFHSVISLLNDILVITCPSLSAPSNGQVNYSTDATPPHDFETVAIFTCDTGFVLNGTERVTCESGGFRRNGLWSGSSPTCTGKNDVTLL